MAEFVISYDLRSSKNDDPHHVQLIQRLKSYSYHCRLQYSVWLVGTKDKFDQDDVFDDIKQYMQEKDFLLVFDYSGGLSHHGEQGNFKNCFTNRTSVSNGISSKTKWGAKLHD